MDNEGLIDDIKSKYILKDIFKYVQDDNYQNELFLYSKSIKKN